MFYIRNPYYISVICSNHLQGLCDVPDYRMWWVFLHPRPFRRLKYTHKVNDMTRSITHCTINTKSATIFGGVSSAAVNGDVWSAIQIENNYHPSIIFKNIIQLYGQHNACWWPCNVVFWDTYNEVFYFFKATKFILDIYTLSFKTLWCDIYIPYNKYYVVNLDSYKGESA